jgi:zinc finger protein MSN2/4
MLECDECPLAFTQKGALISHHRALHTTDRPYVCSVCAKKFAVAGGRNVHEKTHSMLKIVVVK